MQVGAVSLSMYIHVLTRTLSLSNGRAKKDNR